MLECNSKKCKMVKIKKNNNNRKITISIITIIRLDLGAKKKFKAGLGT